MYAITHNHNETVLADDGRPPAASTLRWLVRRGAAALAMAGLLGVAAGISTSAGLSSSPDGFGSSPGASSSAEQPVLDAETVEDLETGDADVALLGAAMPSINVGYC